MRKASASLVSKGHRIDGQAALLLGLSLALVLDRSTLVSDLLGEESPTSQASESPSTDPESPQAGPGVLTLWTLADCGQSAARPETRPMPAPGPS